MDHLQPEPDLKVLSEGLTDEDPQVREDCAQQLASLAHPEAAPFLRHALDDDEAQVRMWGAYGLGLLAREEDRAELARAAAQDESPLVRVWATFGRARLGDAEAVAQLVAFLDLPDLELKSNAADALLTLEDVSRARPLLEKRFAAPDERKRVWAAAVLHRLGHPEAFAAWREALVRPETRVDAAMVAPHLGTTGAARELVRVTAELTQEELEAPVPAANELPLAELLTTPLLELDLDALLQEAVEDGSLRADLLLLLLRGPSADPDVLAQLYELAGSLEPAALAQDVAGLLSEQAPEERPALLARLVDFAADAVIPAIAALTSEERGALIDAVADAAASPSEANAFHRPLLELLRQSPWAEQLADLPEAPWGEEPEDEAEDALGEDEDDVAGIIERIAAGEEVPAEERALAEQTLAELGMTAEEFVESLNQNLEEEALQEPPEPEQVALRALALGAMLERARLEGELSARALEPADAKQACTGLRAWVEAEGVDVVLSPLELELLDAVPGDWLEEDRELARLSADALATLLWAVGKLPSLPPGEPASADALLEELPLMARAEDFIASVGPREGEELERQRELYETLLWRCEQESTARLIARGEEVESEIDVEDLLDELVKDGFEAKAIRAKGGEAAVRAEALRFLGKKAAEKLAEEGLLAPVHGDFGFRGKALTAVSEEDLQAATALAHERQRALNWVLCGGEWDELPIEDGEAGEGEEELG